MINTEKILFTSALKRLPILLVFLFASLSVSAQKDIDILNQGIELVEQEKYNEASFIFTLLIMKKDASEQIKQEAYAHRGFSFLSLKEYKKAEKDLKKAISLDEQNPKAKHWLGDVYLETDKYDEAVKWFDAALALDLTNATIYNKRGMAYHYLEKYTLALNDYNSAIQYNNQYASAYNNRGAVTYHNQGLAKAHKLDIQSAINDFTKAITYYPYLCEAHKNRALAYSFLKKYELAMDDIDNAIACDEKAYDNWLAKGEIENSMGEYDDARASQLKAIELNPKSEEAYYNLSNTEMLLGNFDAARDYVLQASEFIHKKNPAIDYRLAQIEALDGNLNLAVSYLLKADKKGYFAERENFQNFLADKAFEPYKKEPEFKKAFEKIRN